MLKMKEYRKETVSNIPVFFGYFKEQTTLVSDSLTKNRKTFKI